MLRKTAFLIIPLCMLACAMVRPKIGTEEELKARVNTYWQYKVKGEFAGAYNLESPDLRKKMSLTHYIQAYVGGLMILGAEVQSITIDGMYATVRLKIRYSVLGMFTPRKGLMREVRDYWQFTDGNWYHRMKPPPKTTE